MPPDGEPGRMSAAPVRREPDFNKWPHAELLARVRAALRALPVHFLTETRIEGIAATDIFTLNAMLGATIEDQVVATLNRMRPAWDPDGRYARFGFVRRPQTFPDVLLQAGGEPPLMGIELKGWYLLSKEGEPSFRYRVTPAACNPQDLLAVVPWALRNVLSGDPVVFEPFIESALYAAEKRNHYWREERKTSQDAAIHSPSGATPYPDKRDRIEDRPARDAGNFGRVARYGLMDDFTAGALSVELRGISAKYWLGFLKAFTESRDDQAVSAEIEKMRKKIRQHRGAGESGLAEKILDVLREEVG